MKNIWLIGAGEMSKDYVKVLRGLEKNFLVISRGEKSAAKFREENKCDVIYGGLSEYLKKCPEICDHAIVSVGVEMLASTTSELLNYGVKNILVEKPAGLSQKEIEDVANLANEKKANVLVAYNRRFYASTLKAKEIIKNDGGITSFNFEFTEWSHQIEVIEKAHGVKENWFLANSSHVVDLAFYLGGMPAKIAAFSNGTLSWHPSASIFSGAGVSTTGALFSYQANWESAGRWGVEVLTKNCRLIFRPMEKLHVMNRGSVAITQVEIDESLDHNFKPGLYLQVRNFLNNQFTDFCTIQNQKDLIGTYCKMANY